MSDLHLWSFSASHSVAPNPSERWNNTFYLLAQNGRWGIMLDSLPYSSPILSQFCWRSFPNLSQIHSSMEHMVLSPFPSILSSMATSTWYLDSSWTKPEHVDHLPFPFSSPISHLLHSSMHSCRSPAIPSIFILLCLCTFCFPYPEYPHFPYLFPQNG